MNRIIVTGNGFDKAHGMATSYRDFIDNYWNKVAEQIFSKYKRVISEEYNLLVRLDTYEDLFIKAHASPSEQKDGQIELLCSKEDAYSVLRGLIVQYNRCNMYGDTFHLIFKNKFFKHISEQCSLVNWVDVENEYYGQLKELLNEKNPIVRNEKAKELNREFDAVKKLLENYLTQIVHDAEIENHSSIRDAFFCPIEPTEIAYGKQPAFFDSISEQMYETGDYDGFLYDREHAPDYTLFRSGEEMLQYYVRKQLKNDKFKKEYCTPHYTLILNFNYTRTAEKFYPDSERACQVIHIHGELNSNDNPIIFGYGDELDDAYKSIEKLQDNDFLENIKSIRYHETDNYRRLLNFIESEPYQVLVMGHSCGNSDRTLLNTLFEHRNCISIKVYYHQREDGTDNYSDLIRNLSRNFNDKAAMRDTIVNKKMCSPLVPVIRNR